MVIKSIVTPHIHQKKGSDNGRALKLTAKSSDHTMLDFILHQNANNIKDIYNLPVQAFRLLRRFDLLRPRMQYLRPYPIGFSISWRCRLFLGTRLGFLHQFYLHFEIHEHEPVPGVSPRHIAQFHRSPPQ